MLELDDCANAIPATLQIISDANSGSYDCLELLEWLMVRRFKPLADSESFRNDPETARDHFLSMNAQLANWPTDDLKAHYFVPFTVFVSQLEDHQRQAIREWLQSSHSQTLEPLMAEQWLMALDLAAALAAASSVEPTEPPITLAQARDRLLTHVGNDNSNMNYRCATSLLWLYSNRDWTNPSAATCCNVLQRVVEQDHPSNPAWTNRLLWQWSKLQDIHSIAKVANGLVEANCSSFTRTYVNLLDVERTAAVMTLLYRWDRRAELAKLMRDCRKSELLVHVQACAIQAGHHEVILQQLPQTLADSTVWRNWDEYFDTPFDRTIEFNEQFAAELKLFLSKIEDPGTRLLAEVYFSSVPDPIESPEPGTEPRPLRLHRLAEQYPTTTFGSFHEKFQARRILSRFGKL